MNDYITPNQAEMQRRRGRPPKLVEASEAPKAVEEQVNTGNGETPPRPEMPQQTMIPLVLKCGYFPAPGVVFINDAGEEETFPDFAPEDAGERNRRKLKPGAKVWLPLKQAKVLLDAGKADLDAGL